MFHRGSFEDVEEVFGRRSGCQRGRPLSRSVDNGAAQLVNGLVGIFPGREPHWIFFVKWPLESLR